MGQRIRFGGPRSRNTGKLEKESLIPHMQQRVVQAVTERRGASRVNQYKIGPWLHCDPGRCPLSVLVIVVSVFW